MTSSMNNPYHVWKKKTISRNQFKMNLLTYFCLYHMYDIIQQNILKGSVFKIASLKHLANPSAPSWWRHYLMDSPTPAPLYLSSLLSVAVGWCQLSNTFRIYAKLFGSGKMALIISVANVNFFFTFSRQANNYTSISSAFPLHFLYRPRTRYSPHLSPFYPAT